MIPHALLYRGRRGINFWSVKTYLWFEMDSSSSSLPIYNLLTSLIH